MNALQMIKDIHSCASEPAGYARSLARFLESKMMRQEAIAARLVTLLSLADDKDAYYEYVADCQVPASNYVISDSDGRLYNLVDIESFMFDGSCLVTTSHTCSCSAIMPARYRRALRMGRVSEANKIFCPFCNSNLWDGVSIQVLGDNEHTKKCSKCGFVADDPTDVDDFCPKCGEENPWELFLHDAHSSILMEDLPNGSLYDADGSLKIDITGLVAYNVTARKQNTFMVACLDQVAAQINSGDGANVLDIPSIMAKMQIQVDGINSDDMPAIDDILKEMSNSSTNLSDKLNILVGYISASTPVDIISVDDGKAFQIVNPDTSDMNGYIGIKALVDDATHVGEVAVNFIKASWKAVKNFCTSWLMPRVNAGLDYVADKLEIKPFDIVEGNNHVFDLAAASGEVINDLPKITVNGIEMPICLPHFSDPNAYGFRTPLEFAWAVVKKIPTSKSYRQGLKFGEIYIYRDKGSDLFESGPRYNSDPDVAMTLDNFTPASITPVTNYCYATVTTSSGNNRRIGFKATNTSSVYLEYYLRNANAGFSTIKAGDRFAYFLSSHKNALSSAISYSLKGHVQFNTVPDTCTGVQFNLGSSNTSYWNVILKFDFTGNPSTITIPSITVGEAGGYSCIVNVSMPLIKNTKIEYDVTFNLGDSQRDSNITAKMSMPGYAITAPFVRGLATTHSEFFERLKTNLYSTFFDSTDLTSNARGYIGKVRVAAYGLLVQSEVIVDHTFSSLTVSPRSDVPNYTVDVDNTTWGRIPGLQFPSVHYCIRLSPTMLSPLTSSYVFRDHATDGIMHNFSCHEMYEDGYFSSSPTFYEKLQQINRLYPGGYLYPNPYALDSTDHSIGLLPSYNLFTKAGITTLEECDAQTAFKGLKTADSLMREYLIFMTLKGAYIRPDWSEESTQTSSGWDVMTASERKSLLGQLTEIATHRSAFTDPNVYPSREDTVTNEDFVRLLNRQIDCPSMLSAAILCMCRDFYCSSFTAMTHMTHNDNALDAMFSPYDEVDRMLEATYQLRTDTQNSGQALILVVGLAVTVGLAYLGLKSILKLKFKGKLNTKLLTLNNQKETLQQEYSHRYYSFKKIKDIKDVPDPDGVRAKALAQVSAELKQNIKEQKTISTKTWFVEKAMKLLGVSPSKAMLVAGGAATVADVVKNGREIKDALTVNETEALTHVYTPSDIADRVMSPENIEKIAMATDQAVSDDFSSIPDGGDAAGLIGGLANVVEQLRHDVKSANSPQFPSM